MLVLWIFLSILGISATQDEFQITKSDSEDCDVCDKMDTTIGTSGYAYNGQVYDDFGNVDHAEDKGLNNEIEKLIFQYVEKASSAAYGECIPVLSQYTNCNKDSIHTGCNKCTCDAFGRWNCTFQRCITDGPLNLDHKMLSAVIEKLGNYKYLYLNERFKRSVNDVDIDEKKVRYEDLLKWIYGVDSFEVKSVENISTEKNTKMDENKDTSSPKTDIETDLQAFNDLLTNLNPNRNDNITKTRSHSEALFYNNIDPIYFDIINEIDNYYFTEADDLKISTNGTSNVTITSTDDTSTHIYPFEVSNLIFDEVKETNRSLIKREISDANETVTSGNYNNTINEVEELQRNILNSLNKVLDSKQNELEKLTNIKDKLIFYLKSFGNLSISNTISNNVTNNSKEEEYSNIYLYQFEINQEENLRRHGSNILEKYLIKLKKDIYEVVRDIASIQRLNASIPTNLKVLIRAMKYYINKENRDKNLNEAKGKESFRRGLDVKYEDEENDKPLNIIIEILDIVNNHVSTDDVLKFVSRVARKIIYRIIKAFYTDEFLVRTHRVFDRKYDVLSNLKYLGSKWQNLALNFTSITSHERLHILKFIHTQLSKDVCKLNDVLMTLEFATSRRMTPVDEVVGKKVVFQIANDLNQINDFIDKFIKMKPKHYFETNKLKSKFNKINDDASVLKKSLFEKIKKLLKSSKKEIRNLFRRKVPKTEIVKHIANRKMNEINKKKVSEYKETMQRWQNNMNIMSTRSKRSAGEIQKFMTKIKHIIPGYLRGKVRNRNKTRLHATTRKTIRKSKNKRCSKKKPVSTTPKPKSTKILKRNHTKHQHQ